MKGFSYKQVNRFFFKFLLIVAVIFFCDKGIGMVLKHFYFSQESGTSYRTTYSIDSTLADILVFGSSRANHSYVPEIFEERFSSAFYNTGKDGNFVLYNYAIFKAIIKRYNPKLIIIDINPAELNYSATEYERLAALLPYYQANPEIKEIVKLRGPFEKIKNLSAIYPYNSLIFLIAMGNLESNKIRKPDIKGYVPLNKIMKIEKIDTVNNSFGTIDENKINALKDIISTCQQKNIDLLFVYSPVWSIIQNNSDNELLSGLCSQRGIRYLNLSNDSAFVNNPEYFADINHLNHEGAKLFTNMLIDKILQTN